MINRLDKIGLDAELGVLQHRHLVAVDSKERIEEGIKGLAKQAKGLKAEIANVAKRIDEINAILMADRAAEIYNSFSLDEGIEVLREKVLWGTYGKQGTGPLRWVLLKDMDTEHLSNILRTEQHIEPKMIRVIAMEIAYRISVERFPWT